MKKFFAFLISTLVIAACTPPDFDKDLNSGVSDVPKNMIYYTTADGEILEPYKKDQRTFDATLISNIYEDGKGILTFDNDVTSIGEHAFLGCSNLTSITIPNSVTSIGDYAFHNCSGLTSITIPNSVTSIGSSAFRNCSSLVGIEIPNSVTSIGSHAFAYCSGLTSITIGNSVTSIGTAAFYGCSGLTSITIGNSVTSIGNGAFSGTGWWKNQPDGLVCKDGWLLGYKGAEPTGDIVIKDGTKAIGDNAFTACFGLTSITIPNSVTSIGSHAFAYCSGLESIVVDPGNTRYDSRDNCNAIIETESNTLIAGCKNTIIPNSVTSFGDGAFCGCLILESITIPNSVTSIGDWAFYNCFGLTSITIPNSVTSIGEYAFNACFDLTSITIPNSVTSIGDYAFYDCSGLKEVDIIDLDAWKNISFGEGGNPLDNGAKLYLNGVEVTDY